MACNGSMPPMQNMHDRNNEKPMAHADVTSMFMSNMPCENKAGMLNRNSVARLATACAMINRQSRLMICMMRFMTGSD